ncbi:hypothetical protein BASA83_012499 [Batrachochytrium salamandrivorans]|nr:hypothetical protein BASA83_012499 [Batrachochytrium salamandrivorans]
MEYLKQQTVNLIVAPENSRPSSETNLRATENFSDFVVKGKIPLTVMFPPETPSNVLVVVNALGVDEEVFNIATALDRQVEEIKFGFGVESDIETNIDLGANGRSEESLKGRLDIVGILTPLPIIHPFTLFQPSAGAVTEDW